MEFKVGDKLQVKDLHSHIEIVEIDKDNDLFRYNWYLNNRLDGLYEMDGANFRANSSVLTKVN